MEKSQKFIQKKIRYQWVNRKLKTIIILLIPIIIGGYVLAITDTLVLGIGATTACTANYPKHNPTTCAITDKPDPHLSADGAVIFHYNATTISNSFTADTSDVCTATDSSSNSISAVYQLDKLPTGISICNVTVGNLIYSSHPSRVYIYASGDITTTSITQTENGASPGTAGKLRIYGNPDPNVTQNAIFSGGTCIYAVIYAPYAKAGINGGGNGCGIVGAMWIGTWDASQSNAGGAAIHVPANIVQGLGQDYFRAGLPVNNTGNPTDWQQVFSQ